MNYVSLYAVQRVKSLSLYRNYPFLTERPVVDPIAPASARTELKQTLSVRQINMIAIGGVIGAGLFVGGGFVISAGGPAVITAYIAIGLLLVLVMRMLGELAVASPDSGAFAAYASREFGPWAGVTIGYLAVYNGTILVALEATVVGSILSGYIPLVPAWVWALASLLALTGVNLLSVGVFGEIEFWFALVKVVTIVGFIVLGVLGAFGLLPGFESPGLANWIPFVPNGWLPVVLASVTILFSYLGTEQVAIVAAEAKDPARSLARAIRSVVTRILIFYVGSIAVILTIVPFSDPELATGPYALVLNRLGFPILAALISVVVVTSILSLANTSTYTTSRFLYSASLRRELPQALNKVNRRGVPTRAVWTVFIGAALIVIANSFFPAAQMLTFLISLTGTLGVLTYATITVTQMRSRSRMSPADVAKLPLKMWWHPWGGIFVLVALGAIVVGLAMNPETVLSLLLTLASAIVCAMIGVIVQRRHASAAKALAAVTRGSDDAHLGGDSEVLGDREKQPSPPPRL